MTALNNESARRLAQAGCLPEFMSVGDWEALDLSDCPQLAALPIHCKVEAGIDLGNMFIDGFEVVLDQQLPETLIDALGGKRLGDVVDHRLIRDHYFANANIIRAATSGGKTCLLVDRMFGVHFEDDEKFDHELNIAERDFEAMWETKW